jgi:predicted TIM-barrel enzyme
MSTTTFAHEFHTESFNGKVSFPTGIFIDGQFSAGSNGTTIEYVSTLSSVFSLPAHFNSHLLASSTLVSN